MIEQVRNFVKGSTQTEVVIHHANDNTFNASLRLTSMRDFVALSQSKILADVVFISNGCKISFDTQYAWPSRTLNRPTLRTLTRKVNNYTDYGKYIQDAISDCMKCILAFHDTFFFPQFDVCQNVGLVELKVKLAFLHLSDLTYLMSTMMNLVSDISYDSGTLSLIIKQRAKKRARDAETETRHKIQKTH